jgi:hypothetical protein
MRTLAFAAIAAAVFAAPSFAQAPPPIPAPAPQPPAAPQPAVYYYDDSGKPSGPVTLDEIRRKLASGEIKPETLVWKQGMPAWVAARTLPELAANPSPVPGPGPKPAPMPSPVAAQGGCSGERVYLSDAFKTAPNTSSQVEEGKLKTKAPAQRLAWFIYRQSIRVSSYDACVTVQMPRRYQTPDAINAGLIFAAADSDEIYLFAVSPNGSAAILRRHDKNWTPVIDWKEFRAIKIDPPAKNLLRVRLQGNHVTASINGQEFGAADVEVPAGGGKIGLLYSSEPNQRNTWKFIALKVTSTP